MQYQANLTQLGTARLHLFETFCLASIRAQTNPNFLWIIYTDPMLDESVRLPLVRMLANQSNFLLVPSPQHPHFRGSQDVVISSRDQVWSGDFGLAKRLHEKSLTTTLLETRLDADDGLPRDFVQRIQRDSRRSVVSETDWKIYCVQQHMEWHPFDRKTLGHSHTSPVGYLKRRKRGLTACITAGLTFVFGPRASPNKIGNNESFSYLVLIT